MLTGFNQKYPGIRLELVEDSSARLSQMLSNRELDLTFNCDPKFLHASAVELCKQYGIARSTLFLWVKQYAADETGQVPREIYLLQKEVERLRIRLLPDAVLLV